MKDEALIKHLKLPTHITYISQYITKEDMNITKEQIQRLVNQNLVKESDFTDYFFAVQKKEV